MLVRAGALVVEARLDHEELDGGADGERGGRHARVEGGAERGPPGSAAADAAHLARGVAGGLACEQGGGCGERRRLGAAVWRWRVGPGRGPGTSN